MECYHCGQENNDDAVFCKYCGQQVNEKKKCPYCEKLIDSDSQFCEYCGSVIQEPSYNKSVDNISINNNESSVGNLNPYWKKINNVCLGVFAMVSVFFSLLFTFFIGIVTTSNAEVDTGNFFNATAKVDLFYYLGKCYEDLSLISKTYPEFDITNFYFINILGTILSIAIIVSVVTFSIIALIRYINHTTGRSKKNYFSFVLASNISFVLGTVLFFAFNTVSMKIDSSTLSSELNDCSIAGIVLCCIFLVLTSICKTASLGKLLAEPINVNKICFSVIGIIAISFVAALAASPSILITIDSVSLSFNFITALNVVSLLDLAYNADVYATAASAVNDGLNELYANIIIGLLLEIAIVIMAMIMIATLLNRLSNNNKTNNFKSLGMSIAIGVLSIVFLITTINLDNSLSNYILANLPENLTSDYYAFNPMPLIILVIISVVNIAIQILHSIMNYKSKSRS